jgi:CheY-like chemotaxis protein
MSVDVSRDGLLFTAGRAGYWKGQRLDITFPYSTAASAMNQAQQAEIMRVTEQPGGKFAVAVQFLSARSEARDDKKGAGFHSAVGGVAPAARAHEKQQSVVLAVESDTRSAEMLRNMLQQDGYTVVIVPTAKEALEILRTTIPVVFIAEVESEDMSGHDLCLIIKRNERLQHVPVVLLTRSAQPADYSASHQMGAVVCMAKPFKPERLLHVVRLVAPPPSAKSAYGSRVSNNSIERTL